MQNCEQMKTPVPTQYQPLKPNIQTLIYLLKYMKVKVNAQIINKFFKKLDGRDKSNKMIQYLLKFILVTYYKSDKDKQSEFYKRAHALSSTFSLTRKVLRLGHAIETYADFENALKDYKQNKQMIKQTQWEQLDTMQKIGVYMNYLDIFNGALTIANDMYDDIYCLSQINVLEKSKWEVIGDYYGTGLWWITIIFDFIITGFSGVEMFQKVNNKRKEIDGKIMEENNEEEVKKLKKELEELEYKCIEKFWSCGKFACDFVFCSCLALETYKFEQVKYVKQYPYVPVVFAFFGGFSSWLKHLRRTQ